MSIENLKYRKTIAKSFWWLFEVFLSVVFKPQFTPSSQIWEIIESIFTSFTEENLIFFGYEGFAYLLRRIFPLAMQQNKPLSLETKWWERNLGGSKLINMPLYIIMSKTVKKPGVASCGRIWTQSAVQDFIHRLA